MKKRQDGFTLIELVVTLLCCSLVTVAAMTFLLTGARVESGAEDAVSQRQTARIVLTALENLAGSGKIDSVVSADEDWLLLDESGVPLLGYSSTSGALFTGDGANGTVLIDGLKGAAAKLDPEKSLLSFTLETPDGIYTTSAYCRLGVTATAYADAEDLLKEEKEELKAEMPIDEVTGRLALLSALATQYGSTGAILNDGAYTGTYYSEWYLINRFGTGYESNPTWNAATPWCACFLSWGAWRIDQADSTLLNTVPKFANVDDGMLYFPEDRWRNGGETPVPGDFIFFNWDGYADLDHVGAVLYVDSARGVVYTIEGNSGGKVALRVYALSDSRIAGYGVLDWKS